MLLEVKMRLNDSDEYELVLRTITDNTTQLIHTEVLNLKKDANAVRDRLLMGTVVNFQGVSATASDDAIKQVSADAASAEQTEQAAAGINAAEAAACAACPREEAPSA
jgi:hypothetical protein